MSRLQILVFLLSLSVFSWAHSLDPRSIDRYSEILLSPEGGRLYYVLVYGQNGTDYAVNMLKPDSLGHAAPELQQPYLEQRSKEYLPGQLLQVYSQDVPLRYIGGVSGMSTGHGGMRVNRSVLIYEFNYPDGMPRDQKVPFYYEDDNFARLFAWKQIRVAGLQGVQIDGHRPYENLTPYDYTMLDTGGLLPATRSVSLEITVPSSPVADATPEASFAEALMEMGVPQPDRKEQVFLRNFLLFFVPVSILAGIIVVIFNRRKAEREQLRSKS
ncbi:MAG TPA: hypothetical protein PLG59_11290 [bacterium]|nr:hypothetical protein [bacterium]